MPIGSFFFINKSEAITVSYVLLSVKSFILLLHMYIICLFYIKVKQKANCIKKLLSEKNNSSSVGRSKWTITFCTLFSSIICEWTISVSSNSVMYGYIIAFTLLSFVFIISSSIAKYNKFFCKKFITLSFDFTLATIKITTWQLNLTVVRYSNNNKSYKSKIYRWRILQWKAE